MTLAYEDLPPHSPVGASGAYRWLVCQGSVGLARGVVEVESEYAGLGQAGHILFDICFKAGTAAWEHIGSFMSHHPAGIGSTEPEDIINFEVDKDMADAVQMFLDTVYKWHPDRNQDNFYVERNFWCPDIHPLFYGRADVVYIDIPGRTLHVWDYKHGAGISVDVKENPQEMYYGCGILEDLDLWHKIDKVVLHIVQPRGWHRDGPIRTWAVSTKDLETWLNEVCVPGMNLALTSDHTESGEHCRFCPVRHHACPQLAADMDELEKIMNEVVKKGGVKKLTSRQAGRFLELYDTAKIVAKAANEVAFTRISEGKHVPGRKIINGRADRVWKGGAEKALKAEFGDEAMTEPKLKSPAVIETMPKGAALAERWANKPMGKKIVVADKGTQSAASEDIKSLFTAKKVKGDKS